MEYIIPGTVKYVPETKIVNRGAIEEIENIEFDVYPYHIRSTEVVFSLYDGDVERLKLKVYSRQAEDILEQYGIERGKLRRKLKVAWTPGGNYTLVHKEEVSLINTDAFTPGHSYYLKDKEESAYIYLCDSPSWSLNYPFARGSNKHWFITSYGKIFSTTYSKSKFFKSTLVDKTKLEEGLNKLKTNPTFSPRSIVNTQLKYTYLSKYDLCTLINRGYSSIQYMTKTLAPQYNSLRYERIRGVFSVGHNSTKTFTELIDLIKAFEMYNKAEIKLINGNLENE